MADRSTSPLTTEAQLQNRLDCLNLMLGTIAARCGATASVVRSSAMHEPEMAIHVATYMFEQIGWMADRAHRFAGGVGYLESSDQWVFGEELAKSISEVEGSGHG